MEQTKSYFDFYTWLVENLVETNSNNVIWHLRFQTLDDLWYDDEQPWVDISLLVDDKYYSERIHETELTEETLKEWDAILQSAKESKSIEYNEKANLIHKAIKTIIEFGEEIDPKLIELRNELQKRN